MRLKDMKGLGEKTEAQLMAVGIESAEELIEVGPIEAFLRLQNAAGKPPSLNFLYALIGAVEDRHWLDIAQQERESLIMALDGYAELEQILANS